MIRMPLLRVLVVHELSKDAREFIRREFDHARRSLMSQISDAIGRLETKVDDAADRVQKDVAELKEQIRLLQEKVDAGGASQADIDKLAELEAKVDAIDPSTSTTL